MLNIIKWTVKVIILQKYLSYLISLEFTKISQALKSPESILQTKASVALGLPALLTGRRKQSACDDSKIRVLAFCL